MQKLINVIFCYEQVRHNLGDERRAVARALELKNVFLHYFQVSRKRKESG